MKLNEMFPHRFATGEDLNGKTPTLTIKSVTRETVHPQAGSPAVEKFAIWFNGAVKGIILSRTLATQISYALGSDDTDIWTGKKIQLYPEPMSVAGVQRIAIRARQAPNGETPTPAGLTQTEDEEE